MNRKKQKLIEIFLITFFFFIFIILFQLQSFVELRALASNYAGSFVQSRALASRGGYRPQEEVTAATAAAATVSQELSPFGRALGASRPGTKYPVRGQSLTSMSIFIEDQLISQLI